MDGKVNAIILGGGMCGYSWLYTASDALTKYLVVRLPASPCLSLVPSVPSVPSGRPSASPLGITCGHWMKVIDHQLGIFLLKIYRLIKNMPEIGQK